MNSKTILASLKSDLRYAEMEESTVKRTIETKVDIHVNLHSLHIVSPCFVSLIFSGLFPSFCVNNHTNNFIFGLNGSIFRSAHFSQLLKVRRRT